MRKYQGFEDEQRKREVSFVLIPIVVIISIIIGGCIGEPVYSLLIENQTDQVLTIYVESRSSPLGIAEPGEAITTVIDGNRGKYLITAKTAQGEVVFSETFTFRTEDKYHLQETDENHKGVAGVYKAVIPPLMSK